jgi:FdhD protein
MPRTVAPVPEEMVRLHVNGHRVATWSCSPAALEALAAGRLLSLGYVRRAGDLTTLDVSLEDGVHRIDAEVAAESAADGAGQADHRASHGCGLRFLVDCRPDLLPVRPAASAPPDLAGFPELFRQLFERSPSRQETGGHHTAALARGARVLHVHEEVGRHNGADKAIGAGLLAGLDLSDVGLLTTARISGEIAEKAARAGLAWVASRSVPTTLAVEIATAAGLPLVARAASPDARLFAGRAQNEPGMES